MASPNSVFTELVTTTLRKHSKDIKDNVSIGPGIKFDAKGQNVTLKNAAIQNRDGKLVTVAPKTAANAKVQWPMRPYDKRA